MRRILLAAGVGGLALLGGCSTFTKQDQPEYWAKDYGVRALSLDANSAAMKLRASIEKTDENPKGIVSRDCFSVPVGAGSETGCQQQRNAALATLLVASDDLCQEHLKTIYGNEAYYNILTGSVATIFSGAAAIAGSAAAKSALAAISTFANAERSLLNETIYKNMLVTATSKKIRETRDAKVAALLPGSFKKSIDDYPMVLAIRDAVDYHYSCSFMLGLEKALEEGTQGGAEGKRAKLELEKRRLELYVDSRTASLTGAGRSAEAASDKGVAGAKQRIEAIESQLLTLVNSQAPVASTGDRGADSAAPKAEPASLSKAFYSLKAGLESGKSALSAKITAAKPADAAWTAALIGTLDAKFQAVTDELKKQSCEANVNTLNGNIAEAQGKLAAATGNARTKLSDDLNAVQVRAGRYAARLNTFEATYTGPLSDQVKAIDAAKQQIDAKLKSQIETAVNGIAISPTLCTL